METVNLFGLQISQANLEKTTGFLERYNYSNPGYICLPDTYVVVEADKDSFLKHILNSSLFTLADGKPIEFIAKLKGIKNLSTVSGYWLCDALLQSSLSHFFYGSNIKTLNNIANKLKEKYPNAHIKGFLSPPFISKEDFQNNPQVRKDMEFINEQKPDLIWVGLSSPKQDYLMHYNVNHLQYGVMIGVGGVFDYLSENKKISPEWIKKLGFRWLYRFLKEPHRLYRKYFIAITGFIVLLVNDLFNSKRK